MLASLIIVFREVFEAGLIVGIVRRDGEARRAPSASLRRGAIDRWRSIAGLASAAKGPMAVGIGR